MQITLPKAPARSFWIISFAFVVALQWLSVTSASATSLEQALPPLKSTFAETGEEVQLGGVSGLAVNRTGAGGVPAGTVYGITLFSGTVKVVQFVPEVPEPPDFKESEGGLKFNQAWEVLLVEGSYKRCGPGSEGSGPCSTQPGEILHNFDIDVDQATGNVFVFYASGAPAGAPTIIEYKPNGSGIVARFGKEAGAGETTAATPGNVHSSGFTNGIAVGSSGDVYVFDLNGFVDNRYRLMKFEEETPGDPTHYVYAGEGSDLASGVFNNGVSKLPTFPVTDAAGNIYVAGENYILEYDPAQPNAPICEFSLGIGGIRAMTVDPASGEVFYYTYINRKVHVLSACKEGKFIETGSVAVAPPRANLSALVFDPVRQFPGMRRPGVLYGAAPAADDGAGHGEPGKTSIGYIFAPAAENPPLILSEAADHVTTSSADLEASINPNSAQTSYAFQYLTQTAYEENGESFAGATEAPLGGAVLGEGQLPLTAAVPLVGLKADTAYRYRVVATSHCAPTEKEKVCEATGKAKAFRTFPILSPGLPDERAYELVSPTEKYGGEVFPASPNTASCVIECTVKPGTSALHYPMQSAPDGEAVVYGGGPFSVSGGPAYQNAYISRRDSKRGWQTTTLSPPAVGISGGAQGYRGFNPDLAHGVLNQITSTLTPDAPSGYPNLYTQPSADPLSLTPLVTQEPPNRPAGEAFKIRYVGSSADGSRIFFAANDALTEASEFAPEAIDGGEGKDNLYEWDEGQLALVNVAPGNAATTPGASFGAGNAHSVSGDGSRAFFEDEAHQVYLREDAQSTRAISTKGTPDPSAFLAASPDGSKVLLANGHLHDVEGEETTTDLTQGQGGFEGLVGQSEDLSHVYFTDSAVLTGEEENEQGAKAQAGKDNLYAFQQGGGTHYVATLAAADNGKSASDWSPAASQRSAEASPNGRWLGFLSTASLTGYDNTGPCEIIATGPPTIYGPGPCPEAFLFDSTTGQLSCASCNPTLLPPLGPTTLRLIDGAGPALPQPRYLSDSGRLFFDTQDSLSPFDTNEGVEDVYELEPTEVGDCKRQAGCVSLISAGAEGLDSNFLAADPSGKNVFFTTRDRLSQRDRDELIDLYDAREKGGIPAESEPARGECQGEACQPLASSPNDPTPGSSSFQGAGNLTQQSCAKAKVKRKGRCTKPRSRHHRRHHRSAPQGRKGR